MGDLIFNNDVGRLRLRKGRKYFLFGESGFIVSYDFDTKVGNKRDSVFWRDGDDALMMFRSIRELMENEERARGLLKFRK